MHKQLEVFVSVSLFIQVCCFQSITGQGQASAECPINKFKCDSGNCISRHFLCDRDNDCGDGSDERGCVIFASMSICRAPSHIRCDTGHCIEHSKYCSGLEKCPNNENLSSVYNCNCTANQTRCSGQLECIQNSSVCDGKADCHGGSEETSCESRECAGDAFKCKLNNQTCITPYLLCNGRKDCGSGDTSDEEWSACPCNRTLPSKVCKCPSGHRIQTDSGGFQSCQDINKCSRLLCNHSCQNINGAHQCTCLPGYFLKAANNKSCETPTFLYQRQTSLKVSNLNMSAALGEDVEVPVSSIEGYDFDSYSKTIYWTNAKEGVIGTVKIGDQVPDGRILFRNLNSPTLIAFDWILRNLFVITSTTKDGPPAIMICSAQVPVPVPQLEEDNSGVCSTLYALAGENITVTGLALAPKNGYLFWTQISKGNGSIWRAKIDGSGISQLAAQIVINPNGLALDLVTNRILWIDYSKSNATVESMNFDGCNKTIIIRMETTVYAQQSSWPADNQGLALFKDQLVWFENDEMYRCSISRWQQSVGPSVTRNCSTLKKSYFSTARNPKILNTELQPRGSNPCDDNLCSFICTAKVTDDSPTSKRVPDEYPYKCLCPDNFKPNDENNFNCTRAKTTTTKTAIKSFVPKDSTTPVLASLNHPYSKSILLLSILFTLLTIVVCLRRQRKREENQQGANNGLYIQFQNDSERERFSSVE